jgi:PAS domain S-box-containing protein
MDREIKILILEDNESDLELIKYELKKLNIKYKLTEATNRTEYIEALNIELPDIVLSDFNLPDIDGDETLFMLKLRDNEIPFILISSTIGEEKAVELMRNGAKDYIMKDKLMKLVPTIERELKDYDDRIKAKLDHIELLRLTTAINQSPSIVVLADTEGVVKYVNPRFTKITGYSSEEILNENSNILKSGEMSDKSYSELWSTIKSGKTWKGEFRNRKKNGELYWEGATIAPVFDENGKLINFLKVSQDITDKKQLEKELTKEKESLISSNKELEQFAYIASHDLQEPLRIISSFAQLLELKYSQKLNDEAKSYIEFVVTGTKRMQNLIKGLLEYSRITSVTLPKTRVNLSIPLKDALYNLNLTASEARAEIKTGELPDVIVEPDRITQIFQNLIGNALKFRKEDGHCLIEITSSKDSEGEWIISVKDNGAGIDPKDFDKAFIIFNRLAHTSKKPGDGIGLALCKRIIENQGGRIWVESEGIGKGATFKFSLPLTGTDGRK